MAGRGGGARWRGAAVACRRWKGSLNQIFLKRVHNTTIASISKMFSSHKDMAKAIKEESKHCSSSCTGGKDCRVEKLVRTEFSMREAERSHKTDVQKRMTDFKSKK